MTEILAAYRVDYPLSCHQVEKTVLFLLERQGQLAHRLAELGTRRLEIKEAEHWDGLAELPDAYRAVGKDLLKLLHFVEINATGLRKILKKFDKRIGYRLTDEYVASRSNHPYSQLQQVFKHVVSPSILMSSRERLYLLR